MKKRGFPASSVQPLINLWPQVAELLKVRPIEAVTIVEQIVKRRKLTLYVENADTGLWNTIRWGEKAKAMVDRLGCNDYAQKFFNDPSVAVDPEATAIRISPAGFNTILAEASEISLAQPDGMPSITAHAAAGSVQPKEEQERLEEEMERARSKTGKAIAQLIDYKYEIFARLICQAVMGIQEEGEQNPFYHPDEARDSDREIWGDLADAILTNLFKLSEDYERRKRKTSAERVDTLPIVQGDFIAARAWILQNFYPDRVHAMQFTERQLTHLIDTPSSYLTLMEPRFGDTIGFFCELVYHGIPLYELLPDGAIASSPISFAHEDYIYLSQKGRYFDWKGESCYPYWAKRYFIKREHLQYTIEMLVPMISHSPVVFWLLPAFGLRGAGYFLATTETIFGALIFLGYWSPRLGILGALGSIVTFIGTVTIIPFLPDAWAREAGGFPIMTLPLGFLMKDVLFLAASFYLLKQDLTRATNEIKRG